MSQKLVPLQRLLVSKTGSANTNMKTFTFAAIGVYLIGSTAWRYFSAGITDGMTSNLIIGAAAFFVLKYQKVVYVSPVGMVKETHTWITHHRELLRWEDIAFITIMRKRKQTLVFLERDTLGWKLLFDNDQVDELKSLFEQYIPEVEINDIQN
ncbi:MAG: hypothetical protein RR214_01610 [Synergistaceae bacterium]